MAYCGSCALEMGDGARFCTHCGRPLGEGSSSGRVAAGPLEYSIQGDNLQVARIQLRPGQEIYAEAGKMVYKPPTCAGDAHDRRIDRRQDPGRLRRTVMGESVFLTYFRCEGAEKSDCRKLQKAHVFDLEPGRTCGQRDAFV
jgi:hypothetical protein